MVCTPLNSFSLSTEMIGMTKARPASGPKTTPPEKSDVESTSCAFALISHDPADGGRPGLVRRGPDDRRRAGLVGCWLPGSRTDGEARPLPAGWIRTGPPGGRHHSRRRLHHRRQGGRARARDCARLQWGRLRLLQHQLQTGGLLLDHQPPRLQECSAISPRPCLGIRRRSQADRRARKLGRRLSRPHDRLYFRADGV